MESTALIFPCMEFLFIEELIEQFIMSYSDYNIGFCKYYCVFLPYYIDSSDRKNRF